MLAQKHAFMNCWTCKERTSPIVVVVCAKEDGQGGGGTAIGEQEERNARHLFIRGREDPFSSCHRPRILLVSPPISLLPPPPPLLGKQNRIRGRGRGRGNWMLLPPPPLSPSPRHKRREEAARALPSLILIAEYILAPSPKAISFVICVLFHSMWL